MTTIAPRLVVTIVCSYCTTGARGVFHRLEHAGAVNVAACVSLAVVALGPATDAHRVLSSSGFLTRVFDEDVLRAVRRVEQALVAAVTRGATPRENIQPRYSESGMARGTEEAPRAAPEAPNLPESTILDKWRGTGQPLR